jgi:hypothetical protein
LSLQSSDQGTESFQVNKDLELLKSGRPWTKVIPSPQKNYGLESMAGGRYVVRVYLQITKYDKKKTSS